MDSAVVFPLANSVRLPREASTPVQNPAQCNNDLLSQFFCFSNTLGQDLTSFGDDFASKISATQAMLVESLTFTDENVKGVMSAMDLPGVERSNTI